MNAIPIRMTVCTVKWMVSGAPYCEYRAIRLCAPKSKSCGKSKKYSSPPRKITTPGRNAANRYIFQLLRKLGLRYQGDLSLVITRVKIVAMMGNTLNSPHTTV